MYSELHSGLHCPDVIEVTRGDCIPNITLGRHGISCSAVLKRVLLLLALVGSAGIATGAQALGTHPETLTGTTIQLTPVFAGVALHKPVGLLQIPGDNTHWYVLEKKGRIIVLSRQTPGGNDWRSSVLLDIREHVNSSSEGGLLGAAFHPAVAQNRLLFVSYTRDAARPGAALQSVLSRFELTGGTQNLVPKIDVKTEHILLRIDQPYTNHNGGQIAFARDGYLYYGLGDGGAAGDPQQNGQNTHTLLGAMLRLQVGKAPEYLIPAGNPFQNASGAKPAGRAEIYAWGFRNPWRWSFDRKTGALWVADVGQDDWEEVDKVIPGGNYGWNEMEGRHCYRSAECQKSRYLEPLLEYGHDAGRCSITGGYVYRGQRLPALTGTYIYGDFCSGEIWGVNVDAGGPQLPQAALLLNSELNISSFGEDNYGEIYVIDYGGHIYTLDSKIAETMTKEPRTMR